MIIQLTGLFFYTEGAFSFVTDVCQHFVANAHAYP